ncbi:MAG: kynureninase [Lysobacterales bacterium]|jgi:kynureninase
MEYQNSLDFALLEDNSDPLKHFRDRFHHPVIKDKSVIYYAGNSLGLMPRSSRAAIETELDDWAALAVEGHFEATNPWFDYHQLLTPMMADIIGAKSSEVVCMNSLTTNLHLLFVSFYRPDKKRFKIIAEAKMFPSDRYMLETQVKFHGFDPEEAIIEVEPREGEYLIREEDILAAIEEHREELALVFFGAVNYFTGQWFNLEKLTQAAHKAGALAGFDLAHAAGNMPMELHDWNVDFAAWCSYKYLNSGAGNVAGVFIHEKHGENFELPRFGGWWGHDKERRFLMENHFQPMKGAEGWQISNAPVFGMAIKKASLEIFAEAGMHALREKSLKLTGYLEYIFKDIFASLAGEGVSNTRLKIISPTNPDMRGCQLSLKLVGADKSLFDEIVEQGIIADFREPDVIRMAPVPLYNSFEDIYRTGVILKTVLSSAG